MRTQACHTSLLVVLALSTGCVTAADTNWCSGDVDCFSDDPSNFQEPVNSRHALLQREVRKSVALVALSQTPEDAKATKQMEEADEPESAPRWWVSMLCFFAFAFGTLFIMVLILFLLQMLVSWQQNVQARYLAHLDDTAAPLPAVPKKEEIEKKTSVEGIEAQELATLLNGDHTRLDMLLAIANSDKPEAKVQELVEKSSKAANLKLSQPAIKQTCNGLLDLATAAHELHKTRSVEFDAKKKLRQAMRQVLTMVKVSRALNTPMREDHAEQAWTCSNATGDHIADKYSDGHKANQASSYKDVRLSKRDALHTYFMSERWLDHTAIAFVFLYSQTCALMYAIYLKQRFPRMYEFMGPWLLVSRGEAMAIIVITMLMVLMLTRGFLTTVRKYVSWSTVLQTIADKHVLIHRWCGVMLVFCAALHVLGHVRGSLPAIIGETDTSKINAAFTYGTKMKFNFNTWRGAAVCWPAVTGYVLVVILVLFWALSIERVRRYSFELFHYPHLTLLFLWCGMLVAHGWKQWLGVGVPLALLAIVPVVLLYAVERMMSIRVAHDPSVKICSAVVKKRTVLLEIDTGATGIQYSTGMYCMLSAPEISDFQWHPFTIASGGGQRKFQVLFAVVGDWTTKLSELIQEAQKKESPYPRICVRGGYGAPAEGMKNQKHIVMVGGGVGATPFLSFLSNICNSAKTGERDQFEGVETAVFYWVSREPEDFAWVNEYNSIIESTPLLKKRVSIRLCMTKAVDTTAVADCSATEIALFWLGVQVAVTKHHSKELGSELGAPTQFGRPSWEKEFGDHVKELKEKEASSTATSEGILHVSVYACGNKMLVEALEKACTAISDQQVRLRLFAEEF